MSKIDFSTALVGLDRAYTGVNDLLKATGRAPLTARDRDALGAAAERFPLLS